MGKSVSASAEAVKEMSRERVRIFRKETESTSLLERAALAKLSPFSYFLPHNIISTQISIRPTKLVTVIMTT